MTGGTIVARHTTAAAADKAARAAGPGHSVVRGATGGYLVFKEATR